MGKWSTEELALLTKGINKFPPGTTERWLSIANFIGSKSQKEVIHKAKEISEKCIRDVEERREKEEADKLAREASIKLAKETAAKKAANDAFAKIQKEEAAAAAASGQSTTQSSS